MLSSGVSVMVHCGAQQHVGDQLLQAISSAPWLHGGLVHYTISLQGDMRESASETLIIDSCSPKERKKWSEHIWISRKTIYIFQGSWTIYYECSQQNVLGWRDRLFHSFWKYDGSLSARQWLQTFSNILRWLGIIWIKEKIQIESVYVYDVCIFIL